MPQESCLVLPSVSDIHAILYSDILRRDGVWRQPLEIVATLPLQFSSNPMDELMVPLQAWYWRTVAVRKYGWAKQITHQDLEVELHVMGKVQMISDYRHVIGIKSIGLHLDGDGISCEVFRDWTTSRLEQALTSNFNRNQWSIMGECQQDALLEFMTGGGLSVVRL